MGLIGYVRVSRIGSRAGEGYISPKVQRDAISAYASELGEEVAYFADDQDFSGGNTERPAFAEALDRLERGEHDGILVMRIDRFARSVADGARIVREITDRGQVFASCHERIDPRTPEGRFMLTSFLANAELFLDQTKAAWEVAKARAVARGVHIGGTPVGYRREKSKPLIPHPLYGPAVSELFQRAAGGRYGDTALARWMSERAAPEGRRGWNPSEIRRWLSSRVYLGEVHYGELSNTEAHPPLTDPETWRRCQREPRMQRRAHSAFLLSGLVRCDACRYAMGGQTHGGHDGAKPVYRCSNRSCPEPSVILCRILDGYVSEEVTVAVGRRKLSAQRDVEELAEAERQLAQARAEFDDLAIDLEARRIMGAEKWRQALAVAAAEVERWEAKVAEIRERLDVSELAASVGSLDEHGLRDLIRGSVEVVLVRRGRLPVERRALIVPRGVEWEHLPPIAGVAGVEPGDERGETGLDR